MLKDLFDVFLIFLKLGLTSFGGPIAHLGYFHHEFVVKKKWLTDNSYADLVALCQFLPGPASSQVGMAIGLKQAGILGAFFAWLGFTLPSALILTLFGITIHTFSSELTLQIIQSLKTAAVAVVAHAIWTMGTKLCSDLPRIIIGFLAFLACLLISSPWMQILVIVLGAICGFIFLHSSPELPHSPLKSKISKKLAAVLLCIFFAVLLISPVFAKHNPLSSVSIFSSYFKTGALVFGGGHVVLPMLKAEVVDKGFVTNDLFMTGYGAAQAVPGPMFSLAAFLGSVSNTAPRGWLGALLCLVAIFLPSFLLVLGVIPFWEKLRNIKKIRISMMGANAAVVGLLASAFYDPVLHEGILSFKHLLIAVCVFLLLAVWKLPSWACILISCLMGISLL